jgi:hypothetical protein
LPRLDFGNHGFKETLRDAMRLSRNRAIVDERASAEPHMDVKFFSAILNAECFPMITGRREDLPAGDVFAYE